VRRAKHLYSLDAEISVRWTSGIVCDHRAVMEVPPPGLPCDNQRSEFIGNARLLHTGNLLIVAQSWEVLSRANSLVLFG
jgi:hypothetical protein